MANTATIHNINVIGRRLNDLYVLAPAHADGWSNLYATALAAGRVDDDMALQFIGGMIDTLGYVEDHPH